LTAQALVRQLIWVVLTIYLALFVFNATTRTGRFSPDSMNYVNVARNIEVGKGVTQPTLGFNQPRISPNDAIPAPLTAHPPLYPLMISLVSRIGVYAPTSALALSAVATALIFILVYKFAINLYGERIALLSMGLLLFYRPLRYISGWAWSDPVAIALMLVSLWYLTTPAGKARSHYLIAAGLAAGLAFVTRYAFLPLSCVGLLFLVINSSRERRIVDICLYLGGCLTLIGLVLLHNIWVSGSVMPPSNRAGAELFESAVTELRSLFANYIAVVPPRSQFALLLIVSTGAAISLVKAGTARDLLVSNQRYIVPLWASAYLIFILGLRRAWYFGDDRANEMLRMITPAGVVLLVCCAALVVKGFRLPRAVIHIVVLFLLALAVSREVRATTTARKIDFQSPILHSERLTWLANHTSQEDLIIGDDTVDIPFFLTSRVTVSFSPYPTTQYATYDLIMSYTRHHCDSYRNVYIVLSSQLLSEKEWRSSYGDFFADLVFGYVEKYPNILLLRQLQDASVFIVRCR
jgi:4-amino-4-deoxy-L-arabinose transferase-like glycosyltransferase